MFVEVIEEPAQVARVSAEPGEFDHDEGVAAAQVSEAGIPLGPVSAALAGGGLGEDATTTVGAKFVELAVQGLVGSGDAGVADELHGDLLPGGCPGAGMTKSRIEDRLREVVSGTELGGQKASKPAVPSVITPAGGSPG